MRGIEGEGCGHRQSEGKSERSRHLLLCEGIWATAGQAAWGHQVWGWHLEVN